MTRKKVWTAEEEAEIIRIQKSTGVNRKTAIRKMRAAAKVKSGPKVSANKKPGKTKAPVQKPKMSAVASRAEGVRLYNLAGRPTLDQVILVYGERGPKMTWDERAKAGVSAKQFQAALAAKQAKR